ncbi:MAG: hypothetical protein KIT87_16770 [Anaerolineae bacterium]|nr:hypothetical protein [Anaerolineae bacterium]
MLESRRSARLFRPGLLAVALALAAIGLGVSTVFYPTVTLAFLALMAALGGLLVFRRRSIIVMTLLVASLLNGWLLPVQLGSSELTIRPDQIVLLFALVILVLFYLTRQVSLYHTELDVPILGYLGANLASSVLVSPVKSVSYQAVVLMAVYCLMYFATANLLIQLPTWRVAQITRLFVGLGVVEAGYGILVLLLYSIGVRLPGVQLGQTRGSVSIAGTFYEANLFGIYLTLIGAFLLAYVLMSDLSRRQRQYLLAGLGLVVLTLALTLTRSAWLMFGLSGVLIFGRVMGQSKGLFRMRRSVALTLIALAVALVVVLVLFGPLVSELSGRANLLWLRIQRMIDLSDASIVNRLAYYRLALERWQQQPILGWGTFAGEVIGVRWWNGSIPQALHDTGIVGAVFLLWMYGRVIVAAWRESRRALTRFYQASLFAFALGNVTLFLTSQTSSFLWVGFSWVFMGLTIGVVHASRHERLSQTSAVSEPTPGGHPGPGAAHATI